MKINLNINDIILSGKFKNKKYTVKKFSEDDNNQPTIITDTGKEIKLLNIRIDKLMPKNKQSKNENKELSLVKLLEGTGDKTRLATKIYNIADIIIKNELSINDRKVISKLLKDIANDVEKL